MIFLPYYYIYIYKIFQAPSHEQHPLFSFFHCPENSAFLLFLPCPA